jgi:hypothetical protein
MVFQFGLPDENYSNDGRPSNKTLQVFPEMMEDPPRKATKERQGREANSR